MRAERSASKATGPAFLVWPAGYRRVGGARWPVQRRRNCRVAMPVTLRPIRRRARRTPSLADQALIAQLARGLGRCGGGVLRSPLAVAARTDEGRAPVPYGSPPTGAGRRTAGNLTTNRLLYLPPPVRLTPDTQRRGPGRAEPTRACCGKDAGHGRDVEERPTAYPVLILLRRN
jgi:hypothetical protein